MTIYRKIYEQHNGPIPNDENGRTYEIHHIDGNHSNNSTLNLKAVPIIEHFNIHFSQGDYAACLLISERMESSLTVEQKSALSTAENQRRILDGTHNFLGSKNPSHKRVAEGTHNLQGLNNPSHKRVAEGTHNLLDGSVSRKTQLRKIADGSHLFIGQSNPAKLIVTCPYCGKSGGKTGMAKWHFDRCRSHPNQ